MTVFVEDNNFEFVLPLLVVEFILAIVLCIIFSHLFYQLYDKEICKIIGIPCFSSDRQQHTIQSAKISAITSIFFYTFTVLLLTVHHIYIKDSSGFIIIIAGVCWILAQLSCYTLWIIRLHYIFHSTSHPISKRKLYAILFIAILFGIFALSAHILFWMTRITPNSITFNILYYALITFATNIIDLLLSGTMIFLFVNKLLALVKTFRTSWMENNSQFTADVKNVQNMKYRQSQKKQIKKDLTSDKTSEKVL